MTLGPGWIPALYGWSTVGPSRGGLKKRAPAAAEVSDCRWNAAGAGPKVVPRIDRAPVH